MVITDTEILDWMQENCFSNIHSSNDIQLSLDAGDINYHGDIRQDIIAAIKDENTK